MVPRPHRGDDAHARQVEEYSRAAERERRGGRPNDVWDPEDALAYRVRLWSLALDEMADRRAQAVDSTACRHLCQNQPEDWVKT